MTGAPRGAEEQEGLSGDLLDPDVFPISRDFPGKYAGRSLWFVPSPALSQLWLERMRARGTK